MLRKRLAALALMTLSCSVLGACNKKTEEAVGEIVEELPTDVVTEPLVTLPEYVEVPSRKTDVCSIYGINFKLSGSILNDTGASNGIVTYSSDEDAITDISATRHVDIDSAVYAVSEAIQGCYEPIQEYFSDDMLNADLEYYYYSVAGESYMMYMFAHDTEVYYSIVPCYPNYMVVESTQPFYVTLDPQTIKFGDPGKDPMKKHVRSTYEEQAVTNTLRMLASSGDGDSSGTSLFNGSADVARRTKMLSYNNIDWNPDGTNNKTADSLDTTSIAAKASQWTLRATSQYTYSENGLKLYGLYGTKSNSSFSVQGTVENLFEDPRPWVIMLKYLDVDSNIVAVKVLDYTKKPIPGNGSGTFSCDITSEIDLGAITAIQFEMY